MPRASALPQPDPTAAPSLGDAAKVAGWGLVFWGGAQLAATVFARNATAAVAVQAVLAEWGAGRMAIAWSDPLAPAPSTRQIAARAGRGAALGAVVASLCVGAALASKAAFVAEWSLGPGLLAVGLVSACLSAVRDELLLRGVVLRTTRGLLPPWAALVACGLAAAAARAGLDGVGGGVAGLALGVDALRGAALGALWMRDRGAWLAVGASAAWTFTLGSVVRGGLVDVRISSEGGATVAGAIVLVIVVAIAALGAAAWSRRTRYGLGAAAPLR